MNKKETRFTYFYNMSSNTFSTNLLRNRIECIYDKGKLYIPDVVELYQINKYIKDFKVEFEDEKYSISKNYKLININLYSIKDIITFLAKHSLYPYYNYYLWNIISDYYMEKDLGNVKDLIKFYNDKISIRYPLQDRKIVNKYYDYINSIICDYFKNAEIFLNSDSNIIVPKNFIEEGYKGKLFNLYLDNEEENLTCIENIIYDKRIYKADQEKNSYYQSQIHLKAKDKYKKINDNFLESNGGGFRTDFIVQMSDKMKEPIKSESNGFKFKITYNSKLLLEDSQNYSTLLNNFIYLVQIVNKEFLMTSINNNNDHFLGETLFSNNNKSLYNYNHSRDLDTMIFMSFFAYYDILKRKNIDLEEIFNWVFNEYFVENYSVDIFKGIDLSMDPSSILRSCEHLVNQIHRIIRTYNLYVFDPKVDKRQIDFSTSTPKFNQLLSFHNKYAYIEDTSLKSYCDYLFSNCKPNELSNFIYHKYNSFYNFEREQIDLMVKDKILYVENGIVKIYDYNLFNLLKYYSRYGVIPYYWMDDNIIKTVDKLVKLKKITFYKHLFTKVEADYFEYFLSDYFPNGLGIRNKYSHGSSGSLSDNENKQNYIRLMFLLCILIIKINEEFDYCKNNNTYNKFYNHFRYLNLWVQYFRGNL